MALQQAVELLEVNLVEAELGRGAGDLGVRENTDLLASSDQPLDLVELAQLCYRHCRPCSSDVWLSSVSAMDGFRPLIDTTRRQPRPHCAAIAPSGGIRIRSPTRRSENSHHDSTRILGIASKSQQSPRRGSSTHILISEVAGSPLHRAGPAGSRAFSRQPNDSSTPSIPPGWPAVDFEHSAVEPT
ncbi:MAG: hypothetical protein M3Z46_03030 [Actinomycetota bacterium]|nr:hypothetical protein [Actinomycetota bacterium]